MTENEGPEAFVPEPRIHGVLTGTIEACNCQADGSLTPTLRKGSVC